MQGYQNNADFFADFEAVEKNAKNFLAKKLQAKNILKNIIWHLFAGESHHVVKITVTSCPARWTWQKAVSFNRSLLIKERGAEISREFRMKVN